MKKLIYVVLVIMTSALTVVSCTEETIAPTNTEESGNPPTGGSGSPGKI
jgi:hypothetical protein